MENGRAPWPRFAVDCRRVMGPALRPLGFTAKPTPGNRARFEHPQHWVELAWDPYDVTLGVQVDGIALDFLLAAAGLPAAVAPEAGAPLLRAVAKQVAQLLAVPELNGLVAQ